MMDDVQYISTARVRNLRFPVGTQLWPFEVKRAMTATRRIACINALFERDEQTTSALSTDRDRKSKEQLEYQVHFDNDGETSQGRNYWPPLLFLFLFMITTTTATIMAMTTRMATVSISTRVETYGPKQVRAPTRSSSRLWKTYC